MLAVRYLTNGWNCSSIKSSAKGICYLCVAWHLTTHSEPSLGTTNPNLPSFQSARYTVYRSKSSCLICALSSCSAACKPNTCRTFDYIWHIFTRCCSWTWTRNIRTPAVASLFNNPMCAQTARNEKQVPVDVMCRCPVVVSLHNPTFHKSMQIPLRCNSANLKSTWRPICTAPTSKSEKLVRDIYGYLCVECQRKNSKDIQG